jgi:hypothetical protein
MSIRIPEGAKVLTDRRLTLIRILSTLCQDGGRLEQLKASVKSKMAQQGASFAQSNLVVARLSGGARPRTFVDPLKLYALVQSKRITREQFLSVLAVRTTLLPSILAGDEIAHLAGPAGDAAPTSPSLCTEFKPEVSIDLDAIEASILAGLGEAA